MTETNMKPEVKYKLIERLMHMEDDEVLSEVQAILERVENSVVGTSANGTPITQKDLIKRTEKANEDIKAGKFYTQEEAQAYFAKKISNDRI